MIRDLIDEKKHLEKGMQVMGQIMSHRSDQQKGASTSMDEEDLGNVQKFIEETLSKLFASLDKAQVDTLNYMSQKQNEMFQLAQRHKMTTGARNEALGMWYDAKSFVSQSLAELKTQIKYRAQMANCQVNLLPQYTPVDLELTQG